MAMPFLSYHILFYSPKSHGGHYRKVSSMYRSQSPSNDMETVRASPMPDYGDSCHISNVNANLDAISEHPFSPSLISSTAIPVLIHHIPIQYRYTSGNTTNMGNTASTILTCAAPPDHLYVPGTDQATCPFAPGIDLPNVTGFLERSHPRTNPSSSPRR